MKLEAFKDVAREIYWYVCFQLSVGKLVDVLSGKFGVFRKLINGIYVCM